MRIVVLNLAYDATIADPSSLLERYHTLTGLARALVAAGAHVAVVQRFSRDVELTRDDVAYRFVVDGGPPLLPPSASSREVAAAVRVATPEVVHVNGLMFPAMVNALRATLPRARIVLQDHSGIDAPGFLDRMLDGSWRGLADADAYSFTAASHASRWLAGGLLKRDAPIFEIVEASTTMRPSSRRDARVRTGLDGNPLMLWVGRLNANKDPLTVLHGIELALDEMRDLRVGMVYSDNTLEADVRHLLERSPRLRDRVSMRGSVVHEEMALYYSSADFLVSGSHREGSGYALIEAMACGVIPVVTEIPSFRVIAGDVGVRWHAGDARSLCRALVHAARCDRNSESARVRERFAAALSWGAIGAKTVDAYRALIA